MSSSKLVAQVKSECLKPESETSANIYTTISVLHSPNKSIVVRFHTFLLP